MLKQACRGTPLSESLVESLSVWAELMPTTKGPGVAAATICSRRCLRDTRFGITEASEE